MGDEWTGFRLRKRTVQNLKEVRDELEKKLGVSKLSLENTIAYLINFYREREKAGD